VSTSILTIETFGRWDKRLEVPLHNALSSFVELTGKDGRKACEMAIVMMARSAAKMTTRAKKNRKTQKDSHGKYVAVREFDPNPKKYYEWMFSDKNAHHYPFAEGKTFDDFRLVANAGLAKRSWFWGIIGLDKKASLEARRPIPRIATLAEFISKTKAEIELTNRLGYIDKVTPADIQEQAAKNATNQIMAQVAKQIEKRFKRQSARLADGQKKRQMAKLEREWKKAAKAATAA